MYLANYSNIIISALTPPKCHFTSTTKNGGHTTNGRTLLKGVTMVTALRTSNFTINQLCYYTERNIFRHNVNLGSAFY
jgi:hypothetical protein